MNRIDWHRMFGLLLIDFFTDSPFIVELEKDLSLKKQFLDVVVLRKSTGVFNGRLPDGLDNLATHNLITFKSHQESLNDWSLKELTGHYVNYRKQVSPSFDKLLPETEFQLYAVCSRHPRDLAGGTDWKPLQDGVFEYRRGTDCFRVVVLSQLPDAEHNSVLHLLSALPDKIRFGASHYQQRSSETSTLLDILFQGYQREGVAMPYTMEDFKREYREERFNELTHEEGLKLVKRITPQELLKNLTPQERLALLTPQERLALLTPQERLALLTPQERLADLTPQERLEGLSPEEIESYLQSRKQETAAGESKKTK